MLDIDPGAVLDETALCEEFDLSRTPLREVFQSLAGDGYISLVRNRGAKVSSMDLDSMRCFFQVAPMVYCAIGRLAAENANGVQVEELREVQRRFRHSCETGETRQIAIHNHRFHELIGEIAGNPYMSPSLGRLLIDHTRMGQMFYKPANSKERLMVWQACEHHEGIIDAIDSGDPDRVVELTVAHWELSRDRIEKYSRPDPLEFDLEQTG